MYKFEDYKYLYDLSQSFGYSESLNKNLNKFVSKLKERFHIVEASLLLVLPDHIQLYQACDSNIITQEEPRSILKKTNPIYIIDEKESESFISYRIHENLCLLTVLGKDTDPEFFFQSVKEVLEKFGHYFLRSREQEHFVFDSDMVNFLNNAELGFMITKNLKYSAVNDYYLNLLGYKREEYLGKSPFEFIHPDDNGALIAEMNKAVANNDTSVKSLRFRVKAKNGDIKHILSHMQPNFEDGKLTRIVSLINDVTELVESKQEIALKEIKLNSILSDSPNGIIFFDAEGKLDFLNTEAINHFDRHHKIVLKKGMRFEDIYSDETLQNRKDLFDQAMMGVKNSFEIKHKALEKDKTYTYVVHYLPVKDDDGATLGVLTVSQDISIIKEKEKKVKEREAMLNAIFEGTLDGIYALDKEFNVIAINNNSKKDFISDLDIHLKLGDNLADKVSDEVLNRWNNNLFKRVFNGEKFKSNFVSVKFPDKHYENTYTPLVDSNGEIFGCLEVSKNISQSVLSRQQLVESEERYRSLVNTIPLGLTRLGKDGRITFASQRVSEITGYSNAELLQMKFEDFISEEDRLRFVADVKSIIDNRKPHYDYFKIRHKDGHDLHIEGFGTVMETDEAQLDYYQIGFYDITDRVRTQYELTAVKQRYDLLFRNMFEGALIYDFNEEKILDCNDASIELLKSDYNNLIGKSRFDFTTQYSDYYPDKDLHVEMEKHKDAVLSGQSISFNGIMVNSYGEEFIAKISLLNAEKEAGIAYVILSDITSEVKYAEQIKEKTLLYENLIGSSFDGIDIIKYQEKDNYLSGGELVVRNANMRRFFQDKEDLFDDVDSLITLSPEFQPSGLSSEDVLRNIIVSVIQEGENKSDFRFNNNDKVLDVETFARMIHINDYVYMVRNFRDVTSQRMQKDIIERQIQVLNNKNAELQKYIDSNLQLENFAYIASHDLKAPIRSVISFMQLLKRNLTGKIDDKNFRFLEIVLEASGNMQVLIDDLLTYSRINTQAVEFEKFELNKMLDRLLIELNSSIEEKGGTVIMKDIPDLIIADKSRLRQVFQNLITNALKFTEKETKPLIIISCTANTSEYVFKVKDNGIGIESDYLDKIFLMFKKLHSENKYQGTGIGLSICKKVVDQHHGNIWVESEIGKGSTFYFTISRTLNVS